MSTAPANDRSLDTLLLVGVEDDLRTFISTSFPNAKTIEISTTEMFGKIMEDPELQQNYSFIACGPKLPEVSINEIAQALRMQFQQLPIFYCSTSREGYNYQTLREQGFSEAFLFPLDRDVARKKMEDALNDPGDGKTQPLRPVSLVDIQPQDSLPFNVHLFLPANNKYIKYIESGASIGPEQHKRLAGSGMKSVFVTRNDLKKFYSYTADRLKSLSQESDGLSETERKERLQTSVRSVFTRIFNSSASDANFQEGKQVVQDAAQIVSSFLQKSSGSEWAKRITERMGEAGNHYSHATNVSTYGALFSIGLGLGNHQEIAIAGLLHDLGEAELPGSILEKPYSQLEPSERILFQEHPKASVRIIQERKMVVPPLVQKIILQHHERFNGSGFPEGLSGPKICVEAQILAVADEFDELTRLEQGRPAITAAEAIQAINERGIHDPGLLKKLFNLCQSG